MKVVILKQNQDIISAYNPKIKFKEAPLPWSERFCSFTLQRKTFENLRQYLRAKGINPFSVLAW